MGKGLQTRTEIVALALRESTELGLEGLSIGNLARDVGMSKSGLFAHFGSKEGLQIAVLQAFADRFVDAIVRPALLEPRGEARVRALFENWLRWTKSDELPGGCLISSCAWELDGRPGPVRDTAARLMEGWFRTLTRAIEIAVEVGDLSRETQPEELAFQLHGAMLSYQLQARLIGSPKAESLARGAVDSLLSQAHPR